MGSLRKDIWRLCPPGGVDTVMVHAEAGNDASNELRPAIMNTLGASVLALGTIVSIFNGSADGSSVGEFLVALEQVGNMGGWSDSKVIGIARCMMVGASYNFSWHYDIKNAGSFAAF